jgi:hypothetical protein
MSNCIAMIACPISNSLGSLMRSYRMFLLFGNAVGISWLGIFEMGNSRKLKPKEHPSSSSSSFVATQLQDSTLVNAFLYYHSMSMLLGRICSACSLRLAAAAIRLRLRLLQYFSLYGLQLQQSKQLQQCRLAASRTRPLSLRKYRTSSMATVKSVQEYKIIEKYYR